MSRLIFPALLAFLGFELFKDGQGGENSDIDPPNDQNPDGAPPKKPAAKKTIKPKKPKVKKDE